MKISHELSYPPGVLPAADAGRINPGPESNFRQALEDAGTNPTNNGAGARSPAPEGQVVVREGDTLSAIARRALEARGLPAGANAALRGALQLARSNGLANADLIRPGQAIDLSSLGKTDAPSTLARLQSRPQAPASMNLVRAVPHLQAARNLSPKADSAHPVLEKTLDRAVSLGYVKASERGEVRSKILALAQEHHFSPDDLAIVTLLESDGMNPKATNGHCHGLIQFCDGPNRGAATVGFKQDAKAIANLGVLDQLSLVGKYFEETGLKNYGKTRPVSLADLYLTVLTPAARSIRNSDTDLGIAGAQAHRLKENNDPNGAITRSSLLAGLRQNAREKLSLFLPDTQKTPVLAQLGAALAGEQKKLP